MLQTELKRIKELENSVVESIKELDFYRTQLRIKQMQLYLIQKTIMPYKNILGEDILNELRNSPFEAERIVKEQLLNE